MRTKRSSPVQAAVLALAVSLAAGLGNGLLLHFSQFGQQPFETLPWPAVLFFGLLFTGLLLDLGWLRTRGPWPWIGGAVGVLVVGLLEPAYVLAPLAAWAVAALLTRLPPRLGAMLGAATVYVACTVLANFTLDSFIPLGSFFLLNVGTLFFGITFTQRDRVHGFGRGPVYLMILVAAVANVIAALGLGTPLRYVAVSMVSILLSETADTEIFQSLVGRRWLTRVLSSNAVSAPLDTVLFTLLAFVGQPFATPEWLARVILTDVVVKFGSGLAAAIGLLGLARLVAERAQSFLGTEAPPDGRARSVR